MEKFSKRIFDKKEFEVSPSFTAESGVMDEKVEALIAQTWQLLVNHKDNLEYQHVGS